MEWDEARFFIEYTALHGREDAYIAREIYLWTKQPPLAPAVWPEADQEAGLGVGYGPDKRDTIGWVVPGPRGVERSSGPGENRARRAFHFQKHRIRAVAPFKDDDARYSEFVERVKAIGSVQDTNPKESGRGTFIVPFDALSSSDVKKRLRDVITWTVEEIRRAQASGAPMR